jgi:hypothetical protein
MAYPDDPEVASSYSFQIYVSNDSFFQTKTKEIVSCHTADSKPVKQEVNSTVILLPLVFPSQSYLIKLGLAFSISIVKLNP